MKSEHDAVDLIGEAFGQQADVVAIPAQRLDDAFFQLRTGLAGTIMQKFVTYRLLLVITGDITHHTATSTALRDFIRETNKGDQVWFLQDPTDLDNRLARRPTNA
ncbi:hypothetical protein Aph01nite_05090 [Acrocarpospora phusangensis]|uniref:DUF4180 domain-containing protein n=1 Tax=Acrocarpospora phusangensis TaxID=1070424 RepID=A0A919Q4I2_9ACTN|nr:hypothetical protein Aph01nite_05090 [Acrocarpospora phusangensis]